MTTYTALPLSDYDSPARIGILLANLGTPDEPNAPSLRRYLSQFFADPRVFEFPRLLWWIATNGVILNVRPAKSAAKYRSIWTDDGSPLRIIARKQQVALEAELTKELGEEIPVALGMRYGNPSIREGLEILRERNVRRLLVLPLYPQYSATTTGSTFDALADVLKTWRWIPELRMINSYHHSPDYVAALGNTIRSYWAEYGQPDKLLFSFHGIPKRYFVAGDPYYFECQMTAHLVAEGLGLHADQYEVSFQSLFGREEWLRPYTDETLENWGKSGVQNIHIICPGFSADCLETLEENAVENRDIFLHAGGREFHYIPALNDRPDHIATLKSIALANLDGWLQEKSFTSIKLPSYV